MSFIFNDKKLIAELLKNAQQAQPQQPPQPGGVAPNARINEEWKNYLNVSNQLVNRLRTEYFPPPLGPNEARIGAATKAEAKVPDLNTIGNFFEWLARNKVTVNGKRVVYLSGETPENTREWLNVDAERAMLLQESQNEEGHRAASQSEYYVNKNLLSMYMNSLAGQIEQEKDEKNKKMMRSLLTGLMETANKMFGTKMTPDYKDPESEFGDDVALDNVPNPFDPKKFLAPGNVLLKVKDLKSPNDFNAWVQKVGLQGDEGEKPVTIKDENWDQCAFIGGLHERAKAMSSRAIPADKKRMAYYVRLVEGLAGQTNCPLNGSSSQSAGKAQNVSAQALAQVISTLPFVNQRIDFNRIEYFFKAVAPLMTTNPQTGARMNEVRKMMQDFNARFMTDRVISLAINTLQFSNMLKKKQPQDTGKLILPAIDQLNAIIDGTRTIVDQFYGMYDDRLPDAYRGKVIEQIGDAPSDTSTYNDNAEALSELRGSPTIRSGK